MEVRGKMVTVRETNIIEDQSGIAYAIVMVIITLAVVSLIWGICSPAIENLMGQTENMAKEIVENKEREDQIVSTYDFLNFVWSWWPRQILTLAEDGYDDDKLAGGLAGLIKSLEDEISKIE